MDKQMIRIPTDATNLSTDCIGISSTPRSKKMRGRGRPKGSKSKTSRSSRHCRKRTATESHFEYTPNQTEPSLSPKLAPYDSPPRRKKRKPNKAHRDAFPDHTDEAIRRQLALERKAKNRKSAQESRERRKKQETYLNQRLPKGLALKALLQSNKLHSTLAESESDIDIDIENENLEAALSRDAELSEMKMILDEMCDNFASEYDEYPMAQRERNEISDELIIDILKEYVSVDGVGRSADELILETDRDAIHLQVIGEIENGVPMHVDDIPPSATPNAFKATRGRKLKRKQRQSVRLKTPPTIPYTHHFNVADTELPPPVFGNDNIDFNIGPESAVSPYPMPQDTMSSQYHIPSLYSRSALPCIIKHEKMMTHLQLNPLQPHHHSHQFPKFPHIPHIQAQPAPLSETPSTISTNSTISAHSDIKKEAIADSYAPAVPTIPPLMSLAPTTLPALPCHYPRPHPLPSIMIPTQKAALEASASTLLPPQMMQLQHSPMYTTAPIAPCLHTPEQMHFIHPLPARVPQVPTSPIIHHSTQQDIRETKQMLTMQQDLPMAMDMPRSLSHSHSCGRNGKVTGNSGRNGKSFKSGNSSNSTKNGEREAEAMEPLEEMRILAQLVQVVQSFIIIICGMAMVGMEMADIPDVGIKPQYVEKMRLARHELSRVVLDFIKIRLGRCEVSAMMEDEIVAQYVPEIINSIKQHPLLPLPKHSHSHSQQQRMMVDVTSHYQAYRQIAMEILQNMKQQTIYYRRNCEQWATMTLMGIKKEAEEEEEAVLQDLSVLEPEPGMKSILLQPDYFGEYQMNRIMDYSQEHLRKYNESLQEKCFKILSSTIK